MRCGGLGYWALLWRCTYKFVPIGSASPSFRPVCFLVLRHLLILLWIVPKHLANSLLFRVTWIQMWPHPKGAHLSLPFKKIWIWIYICFFFVIWFAFGCFFVLRVTHFIYVYHVIVYHSNCLVKRYVCEKRLFEGCWTWKTFDWNWVGCECLRSRLSRLWPNILRKRSEAVAKSVPLAFKESLVDHATFLLLHIVHHHQALSILPHPFGLKIIH